MLKALLFSNDQKRIRGARKMNLFTILVELWYYDSRNLCSKKRFIFWAPLWSVLKRNDFSLCEHLYRSNQSIIFILLIFCLKSTPCWLTSAKLYHWGHTKVLSNQVMNSWTFLNCSCRFLYPKYLMQWQLNHSNTFKISKASVTS